MYEETTPPHHALNQGLVVDETLQHHHQAPRPLAEWAVGILLQEGKELRSDLGQHGGHVVSCQRVAVIQIHHCILQVAERGHRGTETSDNDDKRRHFQPGTRYLLQARAGKKLLTHRVPSLATEQRQAQGKTEGQKKIYLAMVIIVLHGEHNMK